MVQTLKIKKVIKDDLELALKYYRIVSILNDFNWTPLETEIIAFTAVKGNILQGGSKEQFCSLFNTTEASLTKTTYKLIKKYFLVKVDKKTQVNPQLLLNFSQDLFIQLTLINEAHIQIS